MLKPFVVTLETEVVVMAEDAKSAEKWAEKNFHKLNDDVSAHDFCYSAARMTWYPAGWDKNCLPYGTTDDKTIGEILENDEEYQKKLRELKEIHDKFQNQLKKD